MCLRCQADCGEDSYHCSFCDALLDVVEDGDLTMSHVADGAPMTPERERKIAIAYQAYEELQQRSGLYSDVFIGEGCRWRKAG